MKGRLVATYSDHDFIVNDPFEGEESDIKCRTVKVVTVRKEQKCISPSLEKVHPIKPGERARMEKAIVDGEWGRYYVCLACMTAWFKRDGIPPRKYAP